MKFFEKLGKKASQVISAGKDALRDETKLGIVKNTITGIPQAAKELVKGEGQFKADSNLGVARNTVLGLPEALRDTFAPTRGYTEKELYDAKPTKSQYAQGPLKVIAEIAKDTGELVNEIPGYSEAVQKATDNKVGKFLAKGGQAIQDYGTPKNVEEAKSMRVSDVASNFSPAGIIKRFSKGSKALDDLSGVLKNSLKNDSSSVKQASLDYLRSNPDEIAKGEVRLREVDGEIVIEDGRHRLQVGSETGIMPNIVDVTDQYTGEKSKVVQELIDRVKKDAASEGPNVGKFQRRFSERAKEVIPEAEGIGSSYNKARSTKILAQKAQNLIKEDPVTTQRIIDDIKNGGKDTKVGEVHVAVASELLKDISKRAEAATDILEKNRLYDEAASLANDTAKRLTQLGRDVQAASILTKLTPEGQVRFAAREIQKYNYDNPYSKIPELSAEDAKIISDKMREVQKLPEGSRDRAKAFFEVQEFVRKKIPTKKLYRKITNVWKAGLLTGFKTSGLNIASNLAHTLAEGTKQAPAAIVDSVASLFTGKRTTTFTLRGTGKGTKEGFEKGWDYLKTGFDERNIGEKLDYNRVNFGKGPVAKAFQVYTDTVFKTIGAQDQVFYYGAASRSLMDQALAAGKNKGLKGKELRDFAYDLVKNPDEEMIRYATLDAATAVFQNQTGLGRVAKAVQNIPGVGQFIVPFAQTPSAVVTQIINYSPVGIVKTIIENIGKGRFDQRLFSQGLGRGIVGAAPLVIGAELYKNGMVSLDYPKGDERQQELDKERGIAYNSIKMGDTWNSAMTLGPVGNLLLIGAHFQKGIEEEGSSAKAAVSAGLGAASSLTQQTFMTGVNQFVNAVSDPKQYLGNYLPNLAASGIPTIVSDVARAGDPKERVTTPGLNPQSFITKAQARTPVLREDLQPSVTAYGTQDPRASGPIDTMFNPTRPSEIRETPLTQELTRLTDSGYRVAPTKIGEKAGYKSLTPEQNTQLLETVGTLVKEKLEKLVENEKYQALSDEKKAETIEKFVEKAKVAGRAQYVVLITDGMTREQRVARLKELKEDKLLTEQVFTEYKKMLSE